MFGHSAGFWTRIAGLLARLKACGMGRRSRWPASRVLWNCDLGARVKWDGEDLGESDPHVRVYGYSF
ncbi:uncharacterized protein PGTG_20789 [Puccinia graminis f. sp. tritici CRL 75-36-700-3]|uniref:Uncharacterized protein n=1 Tax=Puccinia graminis f. sp. tritici (strain CRL 75-36-700-3 / race SCCL) TaxID=418459 RepID=H6QPL6_PUCGT|nr:uncharacterized protein PGTG_20789 [Puccinia graminis f. sp. tritici CRL 75-36-700-3]EHS64086.1 hypothetical protein PGTG_20789 [Puccinia graminis f. sp. tritici CRL 75-36-700-3]